MLAKLYTATLVGLDCKLIEVEVDFRKGNTYFSVVGLADKSIQEARDRIPAAIRNSGCEFVPMKIVMNLAPAELPKSGPSFDLPLAIGYLLASDQLSFNTSQKIFLGELALDGRIRPVKGVLPIADSAKKLGFKEIFLPYHNAKEAAFIKNIDIFAVSSLKELINHLLGIKKLDPYKLKAKELNQSHNVDYTFDLSQVRGQEHAKKALEIAAAGGHNILMTGTPGSGKTMISRCLPSILPKLTFEESIEVTRIYSVAGLTSSQMPLVTQRPFRTPHHTSSQVALVGGGSNIKPGEISLAHRGVLFLDEFPEFSTQTLEALRQPLEDKIITISRASGTLTFPANFILVAAMNPCKCGFRGDPDKKCICNENEVFKYNKRISGPILDRIDLLMNVVKVKNEELFNETVSESSESIRKRVQKARDIQLERYKSFNIFSNSDLNQSNIKNFIYLNENSKKLLKNAVLKMNLSARAYFRILKVARTIADLNSREKVNEEDIAQALSFRIETS